MYILLDLYVCVNHHSDLDYIVMPLFEMFQTGAKIKQSLEAIRL